MAKGNTWFKAKRAKLVKAAVTQKRGVLVQWSDNPMGKPRERLVINKEYAAQIKALAKSRKAAGLPVY